MLRCLLLVSLVGFTIAAKAQQPKPEPECRIDVLSSLINAAHQARNPNSGNDLLMALDLWVETGSAPTQLQSVELRDDKVISTGLLCSWPNQVDKQGLTCKGNKK